MAFDPDDVSNEDFAELQRKLMKAGFLKSGFVGTGANWQFDFGGDNEPILRGVKLFLRRIKAELTEKEAALLAFMLEHTNAQGGCSGPDPNRRKKS